MTEWLRVKRLEHNHLPLPQYETKQAAGIDFAACLTIPCKRIINNNKEEFIVDKILTIQPNETIMVPLGWKIEFNAGHIMYINIRQSIGLKGLNLTNNISTIDSIEEPLYACLWNRADKAIEIKHGQKIVQGIVMKFDQTIVIEIDN